MWVSLAIAEVGLSLDLVEVGKLGTKVDDLLLEDLLLRKKALD